MLTGHKGAAIQSWTCEHFAPSLRINWCPRTLSSCSGLQSLTVSLPKVGLGGGSVRINVFPDASARLPKLDLELFHFFGRVNMYVNLVPRANLARPYPGRLHMGASAMHLNLAPTWRALTLADFFGRTSNVPEPGANLVRP